MTLKHIPLIFEGFYDGCSGSALTDIETKFGNRYVDSDEVQKFMSAVQSVLTDRGMGLVDQFRVYNELARGNHHKFLLPWSVKYQLAVHAMHLLSHMHDDAAKIVNAYRLCYEYDEE